MTCEEKTKVILNYIDEIQSINWNYEKFYVSAIRNALKEIEKKEREEV